MRWENEKKVAETFIINQKMEDNLFEIAENLDYSLLLIQSRFVGRETLSPTRHSNANYIDKEVIQYYWDKREVWGL